MAAVKRRTNPFMVGLPLGHPDLGSFQLIPLRPPRPREQRPGAAPHRADHPCHFRSAGRYAPNEISSTSHWEGLLLDAEKILITGATGKIAFPIARALAAAGNEVWGAARLKEPAARERLVGAGIKPVALD